ncbi:MAG: Crp/Fnr family transcriptional regulator [Actinomycetota bacterium]
MPSSAYAVESAKPRLVVSRPESAPGLDYFAICGRLLPICYPRGTQLCMEGHQADGVFALCDGRAKESVTSDRGKTAILRIAFPGDLIGLEAVIGNTTYTTTVETIDAARAYFINRRDLLGAIRCDESFRSAVAAQLSERCRRAYNDIRSFAFAQSVPARVAHFLLNWRQDGSNAKPGPSLCMNLTHEEIGQAIGSTRETVSRIVSSFRRKGWIRITGIHWKIEDRDSLVALVARG